MTDTLNAGDSVQLKSGGPVMTIEWIENNESGGSNAFCKWFDKKDELKSSVFEIKTLTRY